MLSVPRAKKVEKLLDVVAKKDLQRNFNNVKDTILHLQDFTPTKPM